MNRELERRTERNLVTTHLEHWEMPRTIVFYGPEGIGKTTLCKFLRKDIAARQPKAVVVSIDCATDLPKNAADFLLLLRKQISIQAGWQKCRTKFLAFDLALLEFKRQKEGDAEAEKIGKELGELSDNGFRKLLAQSDTVFETDFVSPVLDTAGTVATVGALGVAGAIAATVVPLILGGLARWGLPKILQAARTRDAWLAYEGRLEAAILQNVEQMPAEDVEEYLPGLLASDIRAFLLSDGAYRLVFMLENYHKLWGGEAQQGQPYRYSPDEPLQRLRRAMTDALFVITERSPVIWNDALDDKAEQSADSVYCSELHAFSLDAQRDFLVSRGITDPAIQEAITEVSNGHPIWLKYLAERYETLSANGGAVKPNQIRLSVRDIKGVLVPSPNEVEPWEREAVRRLATCIWFDRDLFDCIVKLDNGYMPMLFDDFCRMSYVRSAGDGTHAIHPVFRAPILTVMTAEEPEKLQRLRDAAVEHLVHRRNLLGSVQATAEAYDTLWRLARGPKAAESIAAYAETQAFSGAHSAAGLVTAFLSDYSKKLGALQKSIDEEIERRRRYDPNAPPDYGEILSTSWKILRDGVIARFEQVPKRVECVASAVQTSLSQRLVADMYHSLKFEGIDIPLDAIERGAASSESAGLPGKVQRHSALRRLVFDEIDAAVQGQGSTYTTLQQDLAKWHTTLVSPVGQALAEGQMIWDRADGWSTFEANVAPPPPVALDSVMARFEQLLREEEHSGARAILALVGMGYVQPFAEGSDNELLGRLLMNKLLAVGGYQWVIVPWQEKEAYLAALTKACELREQGIGEFVSALLQAQSRVPGDAIARDPTAASWRERLPPPC